MIHMAEIIRERVVNRPVEHVYERPASGSGLGMIVGIILLIAFLYLMFMYALPLIRSAATPGTTNVQIPDKVDVNINNPAQK